jgi:anti-anti-sigma factor
LWFRRRTHEDIIILDVISATATESAHIQRTASALIASSPNPKVIANLSNTASTSSAVVARLVALHKKLRAAGGQLVLCELHPVIRDVLRGVNLHKFFAICEDEEQAVRHLEEDASD